MDKSPSLLRVESLIFKDLETCTTTSHSMEIIYDRVPESRLYGRIPALSLEERAVLIKTLWENKLFVMIEGPFIFVSRR